MSPWTKAPVSEKEHPLGACERSLGCEPQDDVIGVTPNVVRLSRRRKSVRDEQRRASRSARGAG
jgi:hypothetical protein